MEKTTRVAKDSDTVKIHYTGTLADGTVFDSSEGREPLRFTLGGQQVIPGFEKAVTGMAVGEKKSVTISCSQAYGDRNERMIQEVPLMALKEAGIELEARMMLSMSHPAQPRMQLPVTVVSVGAESVKLDMNHPLASKDLTFEIELVGVE